MTSIAFPSATSGPCKLADWLELQALVADDKNASIQDLATGLRIGGSLDALDEDMDTLVDRRGEPSQQLASDTFYEIEHRMVAAGRGYPFEVGEQYIQLKSVYITTSTYIFQLLLSIFGANAGKEIGEKPERDFESISLEAVRSYFGHNRYDGYYSFGFPRETDAKSFKEAINELCCQLGEGGGAKDRLRTEFQKDAHLDLVVWHGFPDRRPGQLVGFGQCTVGKEWKDKLTDLPDTSSWCHLWIRDSLTVPPVRMFFMPHRPSEDEWEESAAYGGVLFERCRISYHAPTIPDSVISACSRWIEAVFDLAVRVLRVRA